ncbi:MAG: outer membrane beta-barrel protein [Bacteroidota bacterium]
MKNKLFLSIISFLFISQMAFAQGQGSITAGSGLLFGSEIEQLGIGLNGQYFINDNIAGQVGLNFFFPQKEEITNIYERKRSIWTINLNANYYFDIENDVISPYALAGINISNLKSENDVLEEFFGDEISRKTTDTDFGLNLGAGADFNVSESFVPFGQLKYVITDFDQLVIMAGVRISLK